MTQKQATELGFELLRDSPLSEESKKLAESYLAYIVQRYYLAGYMLVPAKFPVFTAGEIEQMKIDGVIC